MDGGGAGGGEGDGDEDDTLGGGGTSGVGQGDGAAHDDGRGVERQLLEGPLGAVREAGDRFAVKGQHEIRGATNGWEVPARHRHGPALGGHRGRGDRCDLHFGVAGAGGAVAPLIQDLREPHKPAAGPGGDLAEQRPVRDGHGAGGRQTRGLRLVDVLREHIEAGVPWPLGPDRRDEGGARTEVLPAQQDQGSPAGGDGVPRLGPRQSREGREDGCGVGGGAVGYAEDATGRRHDGRGTLGEARSRHQLDPGQAGAGGAGWGE